MKIAVMGAGSWGTTFAKVIADSGNPVNVWARKDEVAHEINTQHTNSRYLGDIVLSDLITCTSDPVQAVSDADVVVLAIPAQSMRANLSQWKDHLKPDCVLVSLMKGIEGASGKRMTEVIAEVAEVPRSRVAVVSGPNLAKEIAESQPTATVIGCESATTAEALSDLCANNYFRPYTNADVVGIELGGAIKNVIALAVGIADGQGLGDNSKASIITRGLAETTRLAVAMGAQQHTLSGLAGLGDLVATCSSTLSRNRTFGYRLGQGGTLEEAKAATNGQVAEGVISSDSIFRLAQRAGVEMPITQAVYGVCHRGVSVDDMIVALMGRTKKAE